MDLDDALAEVVAHSGDRLLRVAYQLAHDRVAAQDLVQEALLRVYRSMIRCGVAPQDCYAYLRRAVVNEYLRTVRLRSSAEVVTDRMPERPVASDQKTRSPTGRRYGRHWRSSAPGSAQCWCCGTRTGQSAHLPLG